MSKLCNEIVEKLTDLGFITGPTLVYEKWCDKCNKLDVFVRNEEYKGVNMEHDDVTGRGDGLGWIDECLLEQRYEQRQAVVIDENGEVFIEIEWEGDDNEEP